MTLSPLAELSPHRRAYLRPLDLVLVAALTAAVFLPNLYGALSPLDDYLMLVNTPQFRYPTWGGYWQFWINPPFRIFMPLTMTVWQAISHFSYHPELEPSPQALTITGFKAASIVVHVLSAVAATWVISIFSKSRWPAIVGGLIFALHPVQVESVCWTTGLKDELCGLFAFLAIGFYYGYLQREPDSPLKSWRWYVSVGAALASMLSKPTGMMVPVVLVAIDFYVRRVPLVRRLPSLWIFLVLSAVCANIIRAVQAEANVPRVPVWARPLVAGDTFAFYLYKLAWPFHLVQDYGRHPQWIWQNGQIWWTWLLPALVVAVLLRTRSRLVLLAAAMFVIPILPVSGLKPFDMQQYSTAADHYLYQPMLGVGLLVALGLRRWPAWADGPSVAVVLVLATLSWRDTHAWRYPRSMYETMLKDNPRSWMARSVLAGMSGGVGDLAYAEKLARELKALRPESGAAEPHLMLLAVRRGHYREAADYARAALAHDTDKASIATTLMKCGAALQDEQMALEGANHWLRLDPGNATALRIKIEITRAIERGKKSVPARSAATAPGRP